MKITLIMYITFFYSLQINAQSNFTMSSIPGPKIDSLHSNIVDEDYRLLITLPFGFSPRKRKYPVLFYLDALITSGMMNEVAQSKMFNGTFDPFILVGISYETNPMVYGQLRERDYMPPINESDVKKGSDEFLQFIQMELIPYMEKNYNTDPNDRGLMGFSLGGLFATWAIQEEPELFHKLAIISPSLWYGDGYLLEDDALFNKDRYTNDSKVFIACGGQESKSTISNTMRLYDLISINQNIESCNVIFPGETHGSVSVAAMARGLYFLYESKYKVLIKKGIAYYKDQDFIKSLEQYQLAFETSPNLVDEDDHYNIACLYALNGNADKAFDHLMGIANSSFSKYETLINDLDLKPLHFDKRWNVLLTLVGQNKKRTQNK